MLLEKNKVWGTYQYSNAFDPKPLGIIQGQERSITRASGKYNLRARHVGRWTFQHFNIMVLKNKFVVGSLKCWVAQQEELVGLDVNNVISLYICDAECAVSHLHGKGSDNVRKHGELTYSRVKW